MRVLASIAANTRRVGRKLDLVQISELVAEACDAIGSLKQLGQRLTLSPEMLRQFLTIRKLAPKVKRLITSRKIDSVDVAHRLSKLAPSDQIAVARAVIAGDLLSDDVRAVVALRKSSRDMPVKDVIRRVRESRNVREYQIDFVLPKSGSRKAEIVRSFAPVIEEQNIRGFTCRGKTGALIIDSQGKKSVEEAARKRGMTKRQLIDSLLTSGGH